MENEGSLFKKQSTIQQFGIFRLIPSTFRRSFLTLCMHPGQFMCTLRTYVCKKMDESNLTEKESKSLVRIRSKGKK